MRPSSNGRTCRLAPEKNGNTLYLVGNGASASMASHMAADLDKNARVHTEVFTDPALITAIANDLDYTQVFSEPLRRRMSPGDMLVAISSSRVLSQHSGRLPGGPAGGRPGGDPFGHETGKSPAPNGGPQFLYSGRNLWRGRNLSCGHFASLDGPDAGGGGELIWGTGVGPGRPWTGGAPFSPEKQTAGVSRNGYRFTEPMGNRAGGEQAGRGRPDNIRNRLFGQAILLRVGGRQKTAISRLYYNIL